MGQEGVLGRRAAPQVIVAHDSAKDFRVGEGGRLGL